MSNHPPARARYQCQLVQAIVLKQIYEARRAQNAFGHLVWMLNEIWPTVGWGSLEYGPPPGFTPGQVGASQTPPTHTHTPPPSPSLSPPP